MKMRQFAFVAGLGCALSLAGCGGQEDGDAPEAPPASPAAAPELEGPSPEEVREGLPAGEFELEFSGALERTGDVAPAQLPSSFSFSPFGGSREEGPYTAAFNVMGRLDGGDEEALIGVSFNIRRGTQPGVHRISTFGENIPGIVTWYGSNPIRFRRGDGTITIVELAEHFTAAWEFTAEGEDDRTITVRGRAHAIPFDNPEP